MKAITVEPKKPGSARLEDVPEPDTATARCWSRPLPSASAAPTSRSSTASTAGRRRARGAWCWATSPSAASSTRVRQRLKKGDLVVGIVRRPDPVPCPNCAVGEWDMCRNGQYTERGIKQIDGFMSERWRIEPEYAIKVDRSLGMLGVLLEPDDRRRQGVGAGRSRSAGGRSGSRSTVLVTGAGTDRASGGAPGPAARAGRPRPRRVDSGPKTGARAGAGGDLSLRRRWPRPRVWRRTSSWSARVSGR